MTSFLVADVNSIDSFVSKRNMEEFSVVIMKRFRSNWFKKTKGRHVTDNGVFQFNYNLIYDIKYFSLSWLTLMYV